MNKGAGISLVLLMAAVFVGCNNGTKPVVQAIKQTSVAVPAQQEGKRDPVTGDCTTSIFAILKSSERFQSLTAGLAERIEKKGGTSYGLMLEGSPNPEKDSVVSHSATYDISLHESYADRAVTISRFSFDPVRKQLFEYDPVHDSLLPIPFNHNMLDSFSRSCN